MRTPPSWLSCASLHVGVDRDGRLAVGALPREVERVELLGLTEGRALPLVTADDVLLLLQGSAVPDLDVHADAPRHEVGAARHPGAAPCSSSGATQTCCARLSGSSALTLLVPSLKPNMLRGVACVVDVDEVRPKPSCDQRTATTPKPIRTRLRTACTATCGSLAQAWMQMSPPRALRVELVAARRRAAPRARPACGRARPKRSSKSDGPKPIVTVSPEAGRP